jgi:hypothetical protein
MARDRLGRLGEGHLWWAGAPAFASWRSGIRVGENRPWEVYRTVLVRASSLQVLVKVERLFWSRYRVLFGSHTTQRSAGTVHRRHLTFDLDVHCRAFQVAKTRGDLLSQGIQTGGEALVGWLVGRRSWRMEWREHASSRKQRNDSGLAIAGSSGRLWRSSGRLTVLVPHGRSIRLVCCRRQMQRNVEVGKSEAKRRKELCRAAASPCSATDEERAPGANGRTGTRSGNATA